MAAKVDNKKPSDSMKSTWRIADRRTWSFYHYFYHFMDICPTILGQEVPKFSKDDKVTHLPNRQHTVWVLFYAAVPVAANHVYITYTGHNFSPAGAYGFYATALVLTAMNANKIFRRLGYQHGYFDGDVHERDGIPDASIAKTFWSINIGMFARTLIMVGLAYRSGQAPASINWAMLPLQIGVYPIVVDFFFYWYHRSMHDVGSLWKFHRNHHLTKHPNALLALYADSEQELCDVVLVPTLAFFTMRVMGLGMGFYEFWVCMPPVHHLHRDPGPHGLAAVAVAAVDAGVAARDVRHGAGAGGP